jgi:hypothetical protein
MPQKGQKGKTKKNILFVRCLRITAAQSPVFTVARQTQLRLPFGISIFSLLGADFDFCLSPETHFDLWFLRTFSHQFMLLILLLNPLAKRNSHQLGGRDPRPIRTPRSQD